MHHHPELMLAGLTYFNPTQPKNYPTLHTVGLITLPNTTTITVPTFMAGFSLSFGITDHLILQHKKNPKTKNLKTNLDKSSF